MAHPTYLDSTGATRSRKGNGAAGTNGDPDITYMLLEGVPAAAALANATANPTTISLGAMNLVYNGATWDRWTGAVTQSGTWTVGLSAAQTLATVTTVSTVTNLAQMAGAAIAMGTGVRSAGTQRVTIATDDSVPVTIASVPSHAVTNAGAFAVQVDGAALTSLQLIDDAVSGAGFNITQLGGVNVAMNTGVRSTGTQRVTIATDDVVSTSQSGTWTVQPGNTANTTAWKVDGSAVTQPVSIATAPVLVAGSAIIGKVGIDQTTPGTTNAVALAQGVSRVQSGTIKTVKNSGGTSAITLASLANAAGRQAVKMDLGATRAEVWEVKATFEIAATPTAGNTIDLYWAPSASATAGTDNPGNVTGADAAYAGYSSNLTATLPQLQFIGSFVCTAQATATVQASVVGRFIPADRYGSLVVVNNSGAALHSTDTNQAITLTPVEGATAAS